MQTTWSDWVILTTRPAVILTIKLEKVIIERAAWTGPIMLKLKLIRRGDPEEGILSENLLTSHPADPAEVRRIVKQVKKICRLKRGAGLSANQVGVRMAFFFISPAACDTRKNMFVLNPIITELDDERTTRVEGCLSLPGREFEVERPAAVTARYEDEHGRQRLERFAGCAAQVFLHEYDHLLGKTLEDTGKEIKNEEE